jgi:archaemetzincin
MIARLKPLHRPGGPPRPGDWRSLHREEGQTFRQYRAGDPTLPQGERRVLYLQPLAEFTADQQRIVALTAEFLGLTFNRPVRMLPERPMALIPWKGRRTHPVERQTQLLTSYVRDEVLKPRLPRDAAAAMALTAVDLWPGEGWNFVYGEASLNDRVGVWSLARNGDPSKSPEAFRLCLLRTLKTASHETAHMFSFEHCTRYECNMAGSDSMEEADRYPLAFCPECLAKLCWATETQPTDHLRRMADFCGRSGLKDEEVYYRAALAVIQKPPKALSSP